MKIQKMDIFEMSKMQYIEKDLYKKSVVPFFKYIELFKNMTIIYILMSDQEINNLLLALENESNNSIMNLTTEKINTIKNNMLQKLGLDRQTLKLLHKKLKNYRYCSDMNDTQYGYYIRWISLKNPDNLKLTNGGIIVDIDIINDCVQLRIKNNMNRIFQIKLDECCIFQKITPQERVILGVLDYLEK